MTASSPATTLAPRIVSYFVSDPGGEYLDPPYTTMEYAQWAAGVMNDDLRATREKAGQDPDLGGGFVVGAHLSDGTSTFEIG